MPILVLLAMAIFEFAFVIESQMGITNAIREAARRAAATSSDAPTWANLQTWTVQELNGDGTPANPGLLAENVQGYDASLLWPANPAVSFCSYPAAGITNYRVQIDLKYKHPVFFGPMALFTDAVDGSVNGYWDLSISAQMRLENVDPTVASDPGACP